MTEIKHSPNYEKVRYYYNYGYWSKYRVYLAVRYHWISADEYKEITGEEYK